MGKLMITGTKAFFNLCNACGGVNGLSELGFQKFAQLRGGHFCAERVISIPKRRITVIKAFIVNDNSAPLKKAVNRQSSEVGQAMGQADFSVAV